MSERFTISDEVLPQPTIRDNGFCTGVLPVVDELNRLIEENEQLKEEVKKLEAQLYCVEDSVCIICKNHYTIKRKDYDKYYISQCQKKHDECAKEDLKYCDDFELKGDVE